jgi:heavy metal sensor kinase
MHMPIRTRLTLWFVFIVGVTLVGLSLLLSSQFLNSLSSSINIGLQGTASQILANVENESERLTFSDLEISSRETLSYSGFAVRLVDPSGSVVEQRGNTGEEPIWGPLEEGYHTNSRPGDDTQWRTITKPIKSGNGSVQGWLQVVQPLDILTNTQQDVRDQLTFMIPTSLFILGLVGYFLASRALQPIDEITRTAGSITASDLGKRVNYSGPQDEVGRLAATFDKMISGLQSAFEREQRFSADAAHELRTPLSVLKSGLEITLSRERSAGEYRETLQDMRNQVERLIDLSNGLLMLSRLEQRRLEGEQSIVNMADVLDSIIERYQFLARKRRIKIRSNLQPVLMVKGYPDALMRLFINLVDNAVKYTPEDGRIELKAVQQDEWVRVEIFNTALNLKDDHLDHLFERFYRSDPSRSRHSGGAGLGLSIAKEIVEAHGGKISVSQQSGEGITFFVELPKQLYE